MGLCHNLQGPQLAVHTMASPSAGLMWECMWECIAWLAVFTRPDEAHAAAGVMCLVLLLLLQMLDVPFVLSHATMQSAWKHAKVLHLGNSSCTSPLKGSRAQQQLASTTVTIHRRLAGT
jgi:hypothetical protein